MPMSPNRPRHLAVAAIVAAGIVVIDQATKAAALATLSEETRIPLLGDLFGLQLAFNPGAILSLGSGFTGVLTLVGAGAVVWLIIAALRARTAGLAVAFGFILGGALGNLIDRLFSPPGFGVGHVTDFLAYGTLFIGNLADVALGIGVILLLGITWTRRRKVELAPSARVEAGAA
ncbi:signal peptidase II [Microbacterium sp. NPDC077391]|uniref:signal peptidase II n=2 Tax=Microbacterium TaxID=33882 RepID=UPI003413FE2A